MPLLHIAPLPRRASKLEVLDFLDRVGGLDRKRVGRIEFRGPTAVIEVPDGWEARLPKALDGQMFGDRRVRVHIAADRCTTSGPEDHFERLGRLLDMESKAEAQRVAQQAKKLSPAEAEKTGNSLIDLVVVDENAGLGGRLIVQLTRRTRGLLRWTRLDVGSPVVISPHKDRAELSYRGVVCERSETSIFVAIDGLPDELGEHDTWRIDIAFDEVATQRQRAALEQARVLRGDRAAILRDVLVGQRQPEFGVDGAVGALDRSLNETQVDAVQFALSARDVGLIHGPPGTGKTTAVVEVIRQAIRRGRKVLACAPSNLAVDNIFERLLGFRERVVRVGHPARVLPELREHTLDLLVEGHRDVRLAHKLVKQAMSLFREAGRHRRTAPKPGERKQLRDDARSLLADARKMELQAAESILDSASVICATTTGIDSQLLGPRRFDLVVIDEACQSTEPGCWIPLLRGDRLVLAGDHCQLPPTVVSQEAAAEGFGTSLFERLVNHYGTGITRRLTVQYRMNQAIMDFSSRELYDGQLEAHASVREHRLCDLPDVTASRLTESPVEFIDTAGASYDEELEPDGESRMNRQEAELVARKVRELLDAGIAARDIAVISPYGAQVRFLREQLDIPGLEIDSVDGFQGREKEAVVISLVRSNPKGEIGFLADHRRMNVAMTRARRKLLIVGDSATLGGHPFYTRLLEYCENLGAYRTVWEEA
ncbi:MAG: IGHMBP2 family helicase [Planctomycetota bacterium]